MTAPEDVLDFWLGELPTDREQVGVALRRWYMGGPDEDARIRERFAGAVEQALRGELDAWADDPRQRLALVLLLDQFTRSVHRNTPRSFEGDPKAQKLVVELLDSGRDAELGYFERHFLLMPLLHAESQPLLERFCVEMKKAAEVCPEHARPLPDAALEQGDKYVDVIRRFGRFPHRNVALGRTPTEEEIAFLKTWGQKATPTAAKNIT